MKNILFFISSFFLVEATTWTPQAPITTSSNAVGPVTSAYDPASMQLFSAWADALGNILYGTYNGSWTTGQIGSSFSGTQDVFLAYNPSLSQMFAAWSFPVRPSDYTIVSAIFNGTNWTLYQIPGNPFGDVFLAYNNGIGQMFATWGDNNFEYPTYSIFDETTMAWSASNPLSSTSSPTDNIYMAYNPSFGTQGGMFAAWVDFNSNEPTYSIYDNSTRSWGPASKIPNNTTPAMNADVNVNLAYNTNTSQMYAAWISGGSPSTGGTIMFSVYTSGTWSSPTTLPGSPIAVEDVYLLYVPTLDQLFAAWVIPGQGSNFSQPYYATYSNGNWSLPAPITVIGDVGYSTPYNVFLSFDPSTQQVVATWDQSYNNQSPYYSTFSAIPPIPIPSPVSSLKGFQRLNDFGTVSELFNTLIWTPPTSYTPRAYAIYKNGLFLVQVPPKQLSVQDHDLLDGQTYTYSVIPLTTSGPDGQSTSVTIVGAS